MKNAFAIPELRSKIFFTLVVVVVFRFGCALPVPFLNTEALQSLMEAVNNSGSFLSYLNMLTGGAFSNATLFAMGVSPYINASIIIQLLTVAIPALEKLSQNGDFSADLRLPYGGSSDAILSAGVAATLFPKEKSDLHAVYFYLFQRRKRCINFLQAY